MESLAAMWSSIDSWTIVWCGLTTIACFFMVKLFRDDDNKYKFIDLLLVGLGVSLMAGGYFYEHSKYAPAPSATVKKIAPEAATLPSDKPATDKPTDKTPEAPVTPQQK